MGVAHARVPGLKEVVLVDGCCGGVEAGPEVQSEGRGSGGAGAGQRVGLDYGFVEGEGCEEAWVEEGEVGSGEWWWWGVVVAL